MTPDNDEPDVRTEPETDHFCINDNDLPIPIDTESNDTATELKDMETTTSTNDEKPDTADRSSTEDSVSKKDLNVTFGKMTDNERDAKIAPKYAPLTIDDDYTSTKARDFPDAFYDPITDKLMEDPVVIADGTSYERSVIMEKRGDDIESGGKLYPNRALLAVINETVEMSGDSFMPIMKQMSKTIQTSLRQLLDKSALPHEEFRPLPDVYYCPITFGLIHNPVIDPEGNTFERVAVETWIEKNESSPLTRTPLSIKDLYPNLAITELLDAEKSKSVENMHPSIRKFIEEPPPEEAVYEYPVTQEDLENRRRRIRNKRVLTFAGLIFAIGFAVLFAMFGIGFFLIPLIALLICICRRITCA